MDDAEGMAGAKSVGGFHHDSAGFFRWESLAALQARRERLTIHVCHDEIDEPVGTFPDRVDRHDVRMRQPGGGFRLAQEPDADFLAKRELWR